MTFLTLAAKRGLSDTARWFEMFGPWRIAIVAGFALVAALSPDVGEIVAQSVTDAYLQVTVFVAATLAIFYTLEAWFRIDPAALLARYRVWQVPIAAALGALPGCGGAIMVITQYIRGGISFGSVVAVLTATMGDAAFLLLAQEPLTGLGIFCAGACVGVVSGYIVDGIHGPDFMRYAGDERDSTRSPCTRRVDSRPWRIVWTAFLVPGLVFGGFVAFQADTEALFGTIAGVETVMWVGIGGAVVSVLLWGVVSPRRVAVSEETEAIGWASASQGRLKDAPARVVGDTCFVTVWVIFAYLVYELGIHFAGVDLKSLFQLWAPLVPMAAILIGFIPGCGPQVAVATAYLSGLVPLSAELGNAISNDGDALFPAIAMAPKAAVIATLYSAIPAIVVAYGWYWMFE